MTVTATTTPDAADPVHAGRAEIDAIDAEIIRLVEQRIAVSRSIQAARIAAGGRRVEHSREMAILDRYSRALGRSGTTLAMTLLELCRGVSPTRVTAQS
jgi:chorismate mutase